MKKFYTLICAGLLFSITTSAQYAATYTANQPGNWTPANMSDPTIWTSGQPPTTCNNCLVQLIIPGGGTVHLNSFLNLTGISSLVVGAGVTLKIDPSTATSFTVAGNTANYISLNSTGKNIIQLLTSTSKLDATGLEEPAAGGYDGAFAASDVSPGVTIRLKEYGAAPVQFSNDMVINGSAALNGTTFTGPNAINGFGILPILLSTFTASLDQDVVNLAWTTTLEENADHIAVERSNDAGAHWVTIGSRPAKNNTASPTDYTYTDEKPAAGTNEYRLQLVDLDGKYSYSTVRTVRNGLIGSVSVFPNPAHDYINVALSGNSTDNMMVRLYNQSGQLLQLRNVTNAGGTTIALSVSGYPTGNYLVVVNGADGSKQTSNVLVSK